MPDCRVTAGQGLFRTMITGSGRRACRARVITAEELGRVHHRGARRRVRLTDQRRTASSSTFRGAARRARTGWLPYRLHDWRMATTQTPIWVTLVTASLGGLLGGLLTLVGVIITQRHAKRREDDRWHREDEREKATRAREDAARSYEYRRQAYVDFFKEFYRLWNAFEEASAREKFDPPAGYLVPLYTV